MSAVGAGGTGRVAEAFRPLREAGRIGLMPFLAAGYPSLEATAACIRSIDQAGATCIEIGIPFSDPIADGPVIQEAFADALARKIRLADIFACIRGVRGDVRIPLVAMVSYSIVYRYGLERFLAEARSAGFDGLILPDLPPPEAEGICQQVWATGLDTSLLVAPTTSAGRRAEIARLCSGFVYYLSVAGVTGERTSLPPDLASGLAQMRSLTDRPLCVGFGISQPGHVQQLKGHADGAIVGTAMVRRMRAAAGGGPDVIAEIIGTYCKELMAGATA